MKAKLILRTIVLLITSQLYAQELTQTLRGKLLDQDSQAPLIGATVRIIGSDPVKGSVSDLEGNFRIDAVPVGRVSLAITYVGYEEKVIPNLLVTAAKELVLDIPMRESLENLEAVVVTAQKDKSEVLNEMAIVSARSFSVEETQRYAGSFNDPARMVSSFAGVTGNAEGNNDIVVRGNSPKGILWRLEGIEIPNPNHFATDGATGGPINALNGSMLANSDFMSGAFAPEYGNALSGVFDMKYKKGNNEQREYSASASTLGIDFAAEGPFSKDYQGSYLVNYRYSSLQLLSDAGIIDFGGVPKYQDLAYNITVPLGKKHHLSMFGLGGLSSINIEETNDEEELRLTGSSGARMGVTGLIHNYLITNNTFLKSSVSAAGREIYYKERQRDINNAFFDTWDHRVGEGTYRIATTLNHKINSQHKVEAGVIYSILSYNTYTKTWNHERSLEETPLDEIGSTSTLQAFTTWKYRISDDITMTSGFHYLQFALNSSQSFEPRLGFRWELSDHNAFTLGAGIHSRLETVSTYLSRQQTDDGASISLNHNLTPTKSSSPGVGIRSDDQCTHSP